jgi:hypothetical protein
MSLPALKTLSLEGADTMTAQEIGTELVALCRQGKHLEAIERFYSSDTVSVEAFPMPNIGQTQQGIEAVKGKNKWWFENHEMHGEEVQGPFPNGDRFIVHFKFDVTPKHTGKRITMEEMGLYAVENGKIAKEEFFYSRG